MNTYDRIEEVTGIAKDGAVKVGETAKTGAVTAWANALTIARQVGDLVREARGFGVDDALGMIGLGRRRSNAGAIAGSFAAGMAVGAGLGILFAPKTGAETRHILYKASNDVFASTKDRLQGARERMTTAAKNISHKLPHRTTGNGVNPVS
jgi:hypothetical protein